MGRKSRRGRNINGILALDKPPGMTSNAALQTVKRLFAAAKAGHTGSLDPLATGVLPLCFGEATKFSQFLLDADKRYLATLKLGVTTETGDADGEVRETRKVPSLKAEELELALAKYRGDIMQLPSMYSALKVDGQPLYKLARQGVEVEREKRPISIHRLEVTQQSADTLTLDIQCSKGTYVRTLAEDLGEDLGCGAHVIALRRTGAGPLAEQDTVTLAALEQASSYKELDSMLLPVSAAVQDWPSVVLPELTAAYLRQGQPVQIANAPTEGLVSIFSEAEGADEFAGVGEILEDGRVAPRRLIV
ncbi:MAG: tRNA pseudouridine(55) synthase TruB [Pseudomonadales bacterium]